MDGKIDRNAMNKYMQNMSIGMSSPYTNLKPIPSSPAMGHELRQDVTPPPNIPSTEAGTPWYNTAGNKLLEILEDPRNAWMGTGPVAGMTKIPRMAGKLGPKVVEVFDKLTGKWHKVDMPEGPRQPGVPINPEEVKGAMDRKFIDTIMGAKGGNWNIVPAKRGKAVVRVLDEEGEWQDIDIPKASLGNANDAIRAVDRATGFPEGGSWGTITNVRVNPDGVHEITVKNAKGQINKILIPKDDNYDVLLNYGTR